LGISQDVRPKERCLPDELELDEALVKKARMAIHQGHEGRQKEGSEEGGEGPARVLFYGRELASESRDCKAHVELLPQRRR